MFVIASLPLLLLRPKALTAALTIGSGRPLGRGQRVCRPPGATQSKATVLFGRLFSSSTTGRDVLWANGLAWCLARPVLGHGIGASDYSAVQIGFLP